MNIIRFIITIVASFFAFFALHMFTGMALPDYSAALMLAARPEDEINMAMIIAGHLAQTLVLVWVFFTYVKSNDIKTGAFYGAAIGLFLAGTDAVYFASYPLPTAIFTTLALSEIVIAMIAGGIIPALLYKDAKSSALPKL